MKAHETEIACPATGDGLRFPVGMPTAAFGPATGIERPTSSSVSTKRWNWR